MRAFVITIFGNEKSEAAAERCIESAKQFGIDVEKHRAITGKELLEDGPFLNYATWACINVTEFAESWSRYENALACFCSHHMLWGLSWVQKEPILILEHDAVFVSDPKLDELKFNKLLSIGKPSYGQFDLKDNPGIYPAFSKNNGAYLGGAHAYIVKPDAAIELINKAREKALPTDIFLSRKTFPWLQELYPWPVIADDSFTTVQNEKGCIAKHNYNKDYEII